MKKRLISFVLLALIIACLLPAAAFATEWHENDLYVVQTTDKSYYGSGEYITTTLRVTNESTSKEFKVRLVNDTPSGYYKISVYPADLNVETLKAGETVYLTTKFSPNYYPATGDDSGRSLLLYSGLALASAAGIIWIVCSKKLRKFMSILLICCIFAGVFSFGWNEVAFAEENLTEQISLWTYVKAGNRNVSVHSSVFYDEKEQYPVTPQVQGDHGTATVKVGDAEPTSETTKAVKGTSLVFTAAPKNGYEFDYWEVVSGGIDIGSVKNNAEITVTMPSTALTLKAHFKAIVPSVYDIIVEADGHGTAKAQVGDADATSAAPGANVSLSATPNDGYAFKEWQIIRGLEASAITDNTFTMPSNEVKVKAIFEKEYTVEVEAGGHGSVSADVAKGVSGKEVNLTIKPESGYEVDQINVIRGGVTVTGNKFNIGTADVKIRVTFKAIVPGAYDIIVENDGHGTASANPTSAAPGATVNLTATPNDGYAFKEWDIARGLDAITGNSFTMPSNEVKVKAIFERVYNITLQTNGHGKASATVGGQIATTAAAKAEVTLTATPNEGYQFKEWKTVSGGVTVTDNKFTMPASNVTVQAVFEAITPTAPTFKAVYNTTGGANTLTFYYDTVDHSGEGITVYEGSTGDNYLFDNSKSNGAKWGYNGIRLSVKSVVIDSTVANYTGLTYTAFMFYDMENAENISGAEYLDVSQVTNMSNMFYRYGYKSSTLNIVPDVSEWNTVNVTTVKHMFYSYGNYSTALSTVPNVSRWNTGNLTDMTSMFSNYGYNSIKLNFTLDLSDWSVASVDITSSAYSKMFEHAAKAGKWSVTIPGFTGAQANNETHWYVGDGTVTEAYIEPASGKQFTVKTTIADVLDTVPSGFPTSDDAAWVNADGKKAYKDGDNIKVGNLTLGKDTTVTKSGDNYVCKSGDATVTFNVKDGAAESITVTGSNGSDGTYAPPAPTEYTVTFDLNGITGTAPEAKTIKDGEKVTKPADPTDTVHTFAGWYKTKDATTGALSDPWNFDTDTVTADMTLYAQWKRTMESILSTNPGIPKVENLTPPSNAWANSTSPDCKAFVGIDEEGDTLFVVKKEGQGVQPLGLLMDDTFVRINENTYKYNDDYVTVIANMTDGKFTSCEWKFILSNYQFLDGTYTASAAPTEYTVTFDLNGISGTAPTSQTIKDGEKVTKPADPTDTVHTFAGWYKIKDATTGPLSDPWDFDNDTVTADMTLYAQWTRTMKDLLGNDFPKSQTNSAPENAWTNANGYKAFIYGSDKYFKLDPGNANGLACLTSNKFTRISDDKYVFEYVNGSTSYGVLTLNIEDSTLVSIEYDGAGTSYAELSGTYTAPASAKSLACKAAFTAPAGERTAAIPAAAKDLTYNGQEQTGVAEGEGYTLSGTVKATNAGEYTATAKLDEGYKWEDDTTEDKEIRWTIKKAELTATADEKKVTVGDEAPEYTITYTGWVNDESRETVTPDTEAVLACNYTKNSAAGDYDITFTTEPTFTNYSVTAVKGKLTATAPTSNVKNISGDRTNEEPTIEPEKTEPDTPETTD